MDYMEALEELRTAYDEWDGNSDTSITVLYAVEALLEATK